MLCTVRVGFQPTQAEKGASLAKSLPSQRPLNLAICERSLSAWIPPAPFPSAHKAPCLLSPCHLPGCGRKVTPSDTIYKILHSFHKTFISDTQTEILLYGGVPAITSQVQRHPYQGNSEDVLEISCFCSDVGFAKTQFQPGF